MLARRITVAFTLVPFLIVKPAALLTQGLRPADPGHLLPAGSVAQEIPLVRWPDSLRLLEAIEGRAGGAGRFAALDRPDKWDGRPALTWTQGQAFVRETDRAAARIAGALVELERLVPVAEQVPEEDWPTLDVQLAGLVQTCASAAALERHGVKPLGYGYLFVHPASGGDAPLPTPPAAFGPRPLGLDLATVAGIRANPWLRGWWRRQHMSLQVHRAALSSLLQELRDDPEGGLREIQELLHASRALAEASTSGALSTSPRIVLSEDLERTRARIARVAEATDLPGDEPTLPQGLTGGRVWLEPGDPDRGAILFEVPDVDFAEELGGADITTASMASLALESIATAVEHAAAERVRVHATALVLQGGLDGH